jgi:hypothetical protein
MRGAALTPHHLGSSLPGMGNNATYNWPAAFVAYARGVPTEEICDVYGIPEARLNTVMREQNWAVMVSKLPLAPAPLGEVEKTRMEVLVANREKNYKVACALRDDLCEVIENLRSTGRLVEETVPDGQGGEVVVQRPANTLKRYWHFKGMIIEKNVEWSMADRVALANYATMVANLTYTALGDKQAAGGAQDRGANDPAPPSITIIMPGAIAAPRSQREKPVTIDLRESVEPQALTPPPEAS